MPRIFDHTAKFVLPALRKVIQAPHRPDFCIGYFNVRGWKQFDSHIENWLDKAGHCCRLPVGIQRLPLPHDGLHKALTLISRSGAIDNKFSIRVRKKLADEFPKQLSVGDTVNEDQASASSRFESFRTNEERGSKPCLG